MHYDIVSIGEICIFFIPRIGVGRHNLFFPEIGIGRNPIYSFFFL